jgi:DHA2 family multidrug resistance protein
MASLTDARRRRIPAQIRGSKPSFSPRTGGGGSANDPNGPNNRLIVEQQGWHPGHNPWAIALTVTMATFMEVLDTSIANVALPHIAGSLSADYDQSTWVLTSYLVSNAVILPLSGWLSSIVGRKRFYMSCVALFITASALCGLAPTLSCLIVFRILQGAGGGGLGPSEQSILADTFPPAQRGMAFAVYGMAVVLAPAVGPTLGGYLTDYYSWRWIFFVNLPVGIISLTLTYFMVEDPLYIKQDAPALGEIDYAGLALLIAGLGCLQVMLDRGQEDNWFASRFIIEMALISGTSLIAFVICELRRDHPIVDLRLFRIRNFAFCNLLMFVFGVTLFGTTVLLPEYVQVMMGYTATDAGLILSPGALVVVVMLPIVGMLMNRIDGRLIIGFGMFANCLALFYMANHLYPGIDFETAVMLRCYQAIGLAFLFVPITTLSYAGVPVEKNNEVSGMVNLMRNLGGSVGISLIQTLIAQRSQLHQHRLVGYISPYNYHFLSAFEQLRSLMLQRGMPRPTAQAHAFLYQQVQTQASSLAFIDTLWILAIVTLCTIPLVIFMRGSDVGSTAGPAL